MVVAEKDGDMVGAEPLLPFRLRVGPRTLDGYQPVDWIVHPDHRRQGFFSRMTEFFLEQYDDADLLFQLYERCVTRRVRGVRLDHRWRGLDELSDTSSPQPPQ